MIRDKEATDERKSWGNFTAVVGYMACSALMLIANKLAVHSINAPGFVLFCQLAGTAIVVAVAGALGFADVDKLEWNKFKRFVIVPLAFLCTIYANIKILQHANVETFITFRVRCHSVSKLPSVPRISRLCIRISRLCIRITI